MKINLYKADLIGLSTESKPTNQIDGTTYYEVDTMVLYIYYKGTWYKQEESTEETEETTEENSNEDNNR